MPEYVFIEWSEEDDELDPADFMAALHTKLRVAFGTDARKLRFCGTMPERIAVFVEKELL
jgi:hypothetical protein